jgi:hypothetical protein
VLRCGTTTCVASGGACTNTGDCCTGLTCNITPGQSAGTCGAPPAPDGGAPDGGLCAFFGQACSSSTLCCSPNVCHIAGTSLACDDGGDCVCDTVE